MASTDVRTRTRATHPFHAAAVAGAFPLFLGALIADYAYWTTHQIDWSNFASWLLVGAMVMTSIALLCEIAALVRGYRNFTGLLVLVATWIVGFFDALHHARDAWAIMPTALTLSVIATVLALAATWIGFSSLRAGGAR
ncbi:MAG: hypothetical protein M3Y70_01280 [Pseudomonadota bacterium]|nr:hypothetical protein [Pseudomonadota bacterium]